LDIQLLELLVVVPPAKSLKIANIFGETAAPYPISLVTFSSYNVSSVTHLKV
jgi:hypothetical protein